MESVRFPIFFAEALHKEPGLLLIWLGRAIRSPPLVAQECLIANEWLSPLALDRVQ
jgi:hypothetical protein